MTATDRKFNSYRLWSAGAPGGRARPLRGLLADRPWTWQHPACPREAL